MTLQDATQFFKSLNTTQAKTSERKAYVRFINLLSALEHHNLSDQEVRGIEQQLDVLRLTSFSHNKKQYFNRKLFVFKNYLRLEHGLVSNGYYTSIGVAMGMCFGMLAGLIFGDLLGIDNKLIIGLIFGMLFGVIIGKNKDSEAERQNRVLKTIQP